MIFSKKRYLIVSLLIVVVPVLLILAEITSPAMDIRREQLQPTRSPIIIPPILPAVMSDMPTPSPSPFRSITPLVRPSATYLPGTPVIEGDVAGAQVILSFITAFNAGQFDAAYQLLDEDYIGVSDCDWQNGVGIVLPHFPGMIRGIPRPKSKELTSEVAEWLRQRIADHDHLFVSRVWGGTLQPRAFGVDFARRTSDTLRRLGFPNGITRLIGAKVILSSDHKRISGFAMGPGPLNEHSTECRPENH